MKLRTQIAISVATALTLISAAVYAIGRTVVIEGFAHVERDQVLDGLARSRDAIGFSADNLAVKLSDWASWDDAYRFAQDGNAEFIDSNMNSGSLVSLRIDAIVILNLRGDVLAAASAHSESHDLREICPPLAAMIAAGDPLLKHTSETDVRAGLLRLGDQAAFIASRPILTSHSEGPMKGSIVFVRMATPDFIARIAERLHARFDLTLLPDASAEAGESIHLDGPDLIRASTTLADLNGRALCRIDQLFDRPVFREAHRSLSYFQTALIAAGALTILTCVWAIRRIVVVRLSRLCGEIRRIERTGDLSLRVGAGGNDELAEAARTVNQLIASTQAARCELAASEDLFRAVADGSPMLVWLTGPDRMATYFNRSWLEFTGRGLEEELGEGWAESVHAEDREVCLRALREAFDARQPYEDEYRMRRHDGEYRWMLDRGVALYDSEGRFKGYIGSCVDITDRREMEERLKTAEAAAIRASQAKSDFVSQLSHEIRTPMTAILGYADLLSDGESDQLDTARMREAVQSVRRNGRHLLALVNDVLDMSKIESGKMTVERLAVAPAPLMTDVASLLRGRAQEAGLKLVTEIAGDVPAWVGTDPLRVRQVLVNLVGNAVKFTREGSVTMRMSYERGERSLLRVDVTDTGVGMSPEQLGRLFADYLQADSSVTRRFGGTGLGLSISRKFARLLGGDITVVSSPGRGSTFTLTVEAPEVGVSPTLSAQGHGLGLATGLSGRVLLAEDSVDSQRLIRFVLERAGATVVAVGDGSEAIAAVDSAAAAGKPFDLILMDTQMPSMDGFEATRLLRGKGVRTPIVSLTAHALEEDRKRCLEAGCDEHATKPIDRMALIALCRRLMERDLAVRQAA